LGVREASRRTVTIESGLSDAKERSGRLIADADAAIARVDAALALPTVRDSSISPSRYTDAARKAREEIARAREALTACESLTETYPELVRGPAPGQTQVANDSQSFLYRWRSTLQTRRDKLDRAESKARLFESP
jgi:hypothetical protein